MKKWKVCIRKISENNYDVWSDKYSPFIISAESENEGVDKLIEETKKHLQNSPEVLAEFLEVSKKIKIDFR